MEQITPVYLDGSIVPEADARIAALTQGLLYGLGVFETFRARHGRVYRLDRHFARLQRGATALDIPVPIGIGELEGAAAALAERSRLDDARLRLTLAGGADADSVCIMTIRAADDYPESLYSRGASAVVASRRRNEQSPLARLKTLNYLDNLLARREARQAGAHEAVLLNTRGFVAEGSGSNLFVVYGDSLATPRPDDGALPGITREAVIDLAAGAGAIVREKRLTLDDLLSADELFLTNAVAGVLPLVLLAGAKIGPGTPGRVTERLRRLYQDASES